MFRKKFTKWLPLGNYNYTDRDFIVFVRKNKKTGMMYFKVRKVHRFKIFSNPILPSGLIDVKKQWHKIINEQ